MAITLNLAQPLPRFRRSLRRRTGFGLGVFLVFVAAFLWYIGVFGGNVRAVEAGRFYRSAQLTGSNLRTVLSQYGIRSVLNLRGRSAKAYYFSELNVCKDLGVEHLNLSLSAYRLPKPKQMTALLATLDAAPRPVLVHCQQGADRSGLVSAIYQHVYEGVPIERAVQSQLTWRYGHFGFVGTWRMDRFFDLYRQTSKGQSLRQWIQCAYPAIYRQQKS